MVDSYDLEEHPRVSDAQVLAFRQTLTSDRSIRLVHRVDPVPSIFGITFPIADSPHDWRYPGHVISIYRESGPLATPAPACFSSVEAAAAALRPPDVKG
jgi:hypothetical protein